MCKIKHLGTGLQQNLEGLFAPGRLDSQLPLLPQHYMDGALSNNMPLFEHRNTITMAPFSGENDICPREGTFNFFEVHYGNVSIQVNTGNVYRVCTSFLPPTLEVSGNGEMWFLGPVQT